jgi:hypothetical protein
MVFLKYLSAYGPQFDSVKMVRGFIIMLFDKRTIAG